jgi:hypothetical protein
LSNKREYTEEQKQAIRDMRNSGDSVDVIATYLRTSKQRVRTLLRKEGIETNVFRPSRPTMPLPPVIDVPFPDMPEAACRGKNTEMFFQNAGSTISKKELMQKTQEAVKICMSCKHRLECLDYGIKAEPYGIWGGATELERQYIRYKTNVKCARDFHTNGNRAMRPIGAYDGRPHSIFKSMDAKYMQSDVVREYLKVNG